MEKQDLVKSGLELKSKVSSHGSNIDIQENFYLHLTQVETIFNNKFFETLSTICPSEWDEKEITTWKEKIRGFIRNEQDLTNEEWKTFGMKLQTFHEGVTAYTQLSQRLPETLKLESLCSTESKENDADFLMNFDYLRLVGYEKVYKDEEVLKKEKKLDDEAKMHLESAQSYASHVINLIRSFKLQIHAVKENENDQNQKIPDLIIPHTFTAIQKRELERQYAMRKNALRFEREKKAKLKMEEKLRIEEQKLQIERRLGNCNLDGVLASQHHNNDIEKELNEYLQQEENLKPCDVSEKVEKNEVENLEKPFKRVDITWTDPTQNKNFNEEFYNFMTANKKDLPDAKVLWLKPKNNEPKLVPSDLINRMMAKKEHLESEDYEDWEYSANVSVDNEKEYNEYERLVKFLQEDLLKLQNNSKVKDAEIDKSELKDLSEKVNRGEVRTDVIQYLQTPLILNPFTFFSVRDSKTGKLKSLKEALKSVDHREREYHMRGKFEPWEDKERIGGPKLGCYGWQPPEVTEENVDDCEVLIGKPKENKRPKAANHKEVLSEQEIVDLKDFYSLMFSKIDDIKDTLGNSRAMDVLKTFTSNTSLVPNECSSKETFFESIDEKWIWEKDRPSYNVDNESVVVEPWFSDWLDNEEEIETKIQEQGKEEVAHDWNVSLINVDDLSNELDEAALQVIKERLKESDRHSSFKIKDSLGLDETLALEEDQKFAEDWTKKHGYKFKQNKVEVLVEPSDLAEYNKHYLTYPFISESVLHPNTIRIRRLLRDLPNFDEIAFDDDMDLSDENVAKIITNLKQAEVASDKLTKNKRKSMRETFQEVNKAVESIEDKFLKYENDLMKDGVPDESQDEKFDPELFNLKNKTEILFSPCPFKDKELKKLQIVSKKGCKNIENFISDYVKQKREKNDELLNIDDYSESEGSDSDEEGESIIFKPKWAPIHNFDNYNDINDYELLAKASSLIINRSLDFFVKPVRLLEWLNDSFDASDERLVKWADYFKFHFPNIVSYLSSSYLKPLEEKEINTENKDEKECVKIVKGSDEDRAVIEEMQEIKVGEEMRLILNKAEDSPIQLTSRFKQVLEKGVWAEEVNTTIDVDKRLLSELARKMFIKFELDNFQKQALIALDKGYNVFVAAHTSAGKTVVAEYAIQLAKENKTRVVYTSPVKALSNQKYWDFKHQFKDMSVGLITGDIQLNDTAECLIMTTEVLRSMLYNGSERIRDLEFVVFDEVHYINDAERGHVWEEVLILLPSEVRIIMLSATAPNQMEFASWVGRIKQRKVIICKTAQRPIPLKHYLYVESKKGSKASPIFEIKNGDGKLEQTGYDKAIEALNCVAKEQRADKYKAKSGHRKGNFGNLKKFEGQQNSEKVDDEENGPQGIIKRDRNYWIKFINYLVKNELVPAVVFAFSRKKCDTLAESLIDAVDLNSKTDKAVVHNFLKSHISKLDEEDKTLPQIVLMGKLLMCGIGIHHSGIIPLLKEMVERLFKQNFIKVLFATETFAVGVNMPARTVIFNSVQKFDGLGIRELLPSEYIQMAGRAGRRNEDKEGKVIINCSSHRFTPNFHVLDQIMQGAPSQLQSQFRLTYRMILNTLTTRNTIPVEKIIKNSFHANAEQRKIEDNKKLVDGLEKKLEKQKEELEEDINAEDLELCKKFYDEADEYLNRKKNEIWNTESSFVMINSGKEVNRPAIIIETKTKSYRVVFLKSSPKFYSSIQNRCEMKSDQIQRWYKVISLLPCCDDYHPEHMSYGSKEITEDDIIGYFNRKISSAKFEVSNILTDVLQNRKPSYDTQIALEELWKVKKFAEKKQTYYTVEPKPETLIQAGEALVASKSYKQNNLVEFEKVFCWKEERRRADCLSFNNFQSNTDNLGEKYNDKLRVLRKRNYITENNTVCKKGYMASRISKYELIVCEILVENVLQDLTPEEVAALLSFLVFQGKQQVDDVEWGEGITENLTKAIKSVKNIIQQIKHIERSSNVEDSDGSEGDKLSFELTEVIYEWAEKKSFVEVMEKARNKFQEGMVVRWIQHLLETLTEVEAAAKIMGDHSLPEKIQKAAISIKRGIVFTPSLYTT